MTDRSSKKSYKLFSLLTAGLLFAATGVVATSTAKAIASHSGIEATQANASSVAKPEYTQVAQETKKKKKKKKKRRGSYSGS